MIGLPAAGNLRSDLSFYVAKLRQARERRINPSLTERPDILRTLQRDGVVAVEGFLDRAKVQEMVDEIHARTDLMTERRSPNIVNRHARYLLLEPEKHLSSVSAFFQSEVVRGLARAYLSERAVPDRPAVQLKIDVDHASIVDFFHIDEWRYLISACLFLSDVGPKEAPMIYLKRSHRPSLWRLPKEKEWFAYYERCSDGEYINEESPYCGCFLPTEARWLRERHGFEAMTCTGKAGTLLLFDNLGLHRSSVLKENYRLTLSTFWRVRLPSFGGHQAAVA